MFCDIPHNWYKLQYGRLSPRDNLWNLVGGEPFCCSTQGFKSSLIPNHKSKIKDSVVFTNRSPGNYNCLNVDQSDCREQCSHRYWRNNDQDILNTKYCGGSESRCNNKHRINKCELCHNVNEENLYFYGRGCDKTSKASNFYSQCYKMRPETADSHGYFSCNNVPNITQCGCKPKNNQTNQISSISNTYGNGTMICCQHCAVMRHFQDNIFGTSRGIIKSCIVKKSNPKSYIDFFSNMFEKYRTACHSNFNSIQEDKSKNRNKKFLKKKMIINPLLQDSKTIKNNDYFDYKGINSSLCDSANFNCIEDVCSKHKFHFCKYEDSLEKTCSSFDGQFTEHKCCELHKECASEPFPTNTCDCKEYIKKYFSDLINILETKLHSLTNNSLRISQEQQLMNNELEIIKQIKRICHCSLIIFDEVIQGLKEKLETQHHANKATVEQCNNSLQTDNNVLGIHFSSTEEQEGHTNIKTQVAPHGDRGDNASLEKALKENISNLLCSVPNVAHKEIKMINTSTQTYTINYTDDIHTVCLEVWGNICSKIVSETLQLSTRPIKIDCNDEDESKCSLLKKPKKYAFPFFSRKDQK